MTNATSRPTLTMPNPNDMQSILQTAVENGASDVFLSAGAPILMKIQGQQEEMSVEELTNSDIRELIKSICTDKQFEDIQKKRGGDWATSAQSGRFRVNAFFQQNTMGAVIRTIPTEVIPADKLGTPSPMIEATRRTKGLILVTGPTGSGKSTTLAALINHINETRAVHILTLEDPIEFTHTRKLALINQRELGTDFMSWDDGLRAAMRQAPDVILIGEMRDEETVRAALKAAETGHLVMGTLHTNGAAETINRIIEFFPSDNREQIQSQLASNIVAIMSQQLVPSQKKRERLMVYELMTRTTSIVANIRKLNISQIINAISTGSQHGMVQMDKTLAEHVNAGNITLEQAIDRCTDVKNLMTILQLERGEDAAY